MFIKSKCYLRKNVEVIKWLRHQMVNPKLHRLHEITLGQVTGYVIVNGTILMQLVVFQTFQQKQNIGSLTHKFITVLLYLFLVSPTNRISQSNANFGN